MKKALFMAAAALIISGTVWGQNAAPPTTQAVVDNIFDIGNAVPTMSTEARYSAGQFTTDVDNFIDVLNYNPAIGTFFFLGGFPDNGTNVNTTDVLGSNSKISLGFAKTFGFGYLGLYYGGNLIRATGSHNEDKVGNDTTKTDTSNATWLNSLAVLYGTPNIGAFRLDLIENGAHNKSTTNDKITSETIDGPTLALTWGNALGGSGEGNGGLKLYVTLGVTFPDQETTGDTNADGKYVYQLVENTGGKLFIQAGVEHDSGLWGDLGFGFGFPDTQKGDESEDTYLGGGDPDKSIKYDVTTAGGFEIGLRGGYQAAIDLGKVSVGVGPNLGLGFLFDEKKVTGKIGDDDQKSEPVNTAYFELNVGIDLGIKFQINEKFALYTGASLQILDWQTAGNYGGNSDYKPDDKDNSWSFDGLQWQSAKWTGSNNLGFGLTFTPAENVVIGFGLNAWLDRLFSINLATMQFQTGTVWNQNFNNTGSWLGNLVFGSNVTFDLTVSVKF
jgi:hypothetical protein